MNQAEDIAHILQHRRTVAVVGLSPNPQRASFSVSRYMQAQGWPIIPINPTVTEVLGEKAYPTLTEAARHEPIELVNVFRNSAGVPPLATDAIAIGAQALWLKRDIEHETAAIEARSAGLRVVQNKCLMMEHASH